MSERSKHMRDLARKAPNKNLAELLLTFADYIESTNDKRKSLEHTIEQQQQQIEELEFTIARLSDACAHLEHHNVQLAATADRLLKACEMAYDNYDKVFLTDPPQSAWKANQVTERLFEAITSTSQQNLAERDAEVAISAIRAALLNLGEPTLTESDIQIFAYEYAQRIKEGE